MIFTIVIWLLVWGALFTGLYNIIAGLVGGIKFNINKKSFEISEEKPQLEKT